MRLVKYIIIPIICTKILVQNLGGFLCYYELLPGESSKSSVSILTDGTNATMKLNRLYFLMDIYFLIAPFLGALFLLMSIVFTINKINSVDDVVFLIMNILTLFMFILAYILIFAASLSKKTDLTLKGHFLIAFAYYIYAIVLLCLITYYYLIIYFIIGMSIIMVLLNPLINKKGLTLFIILTELIVYILFSALQYYRFIPSFPEEITIDAKEKVIGIIFFIKFLFGLWLYVNIQRKLKELQNNMLHEKIEDVLKSKDNDENKYIKKIMPYHLTPREQEVTLLILNGCSYKEIAESLYISIHTVKQHARHIFEKCDVKNRRFLYKLFREV